MGQLHEMIEKQEETDRIANSDSLDTFAQLIPYLLQRREVARMHYKRPSQELYTHMQVINKEIAKILSIF